MKLTEKIDYFWNGLLVGLISGMIIMTIIFQLVIYFNQ